MTRLLFQVILVISIFFVSCQEEHVPEVYRPSNKHKAYIVSLKELSLDKTALGKDWLESADNAIKSPIWIDTPFEEAFYLDPREAKAVGYRFSVRRGQKVMIDAFTSSTDSLVLFIDLFRVVNDSLQRWTHVATADDNNKLGFEPRQDGDYIVRLQPELLRGGRYSITIRKVPTLVFPVAGKDSRAIGSFFGDPRDGGRRDHHGVDIFAKRHTPIIAPVKGYIRRVGQQKLGGNIIWLSDRERGQSLYFAHLQEQWVEPNTWVEVGDTLGTVGNSGNAISTPPHLHFGIYSRGPRDPLYYIKELDQQTDSVMLDQSIIGTFARILNSEVYMPFTSPKSSRKIDADTVGQNQVGKIIGAYKDFYKVELENSNIAYLPGNLIESALSPIENEITLDKEYPLLNAPSKEAISKFMVKEGEQIELFGQSNKFWWIRTSSGAFGWIQPSELMQ